MKDERRKIEEKNNQPALNLKATTIWQKQDEAVAKWPLLCNTLPQFFLTMIQAIDSVQEASKLLELSPERFYFVDIRLRALLLVQQAYLYRILRLHLITLLEILTALFQ